MSLQKPTIVLATGAWHGPHLYSPLTGALEAAGYTVKAPALPSVGGKQDDFSDDVAAVRAAIEDSTQAGTDVVVLMHSYGGVVGGEASRGLSRLDQNDRDKGSVTHLIYMCAFAIDEGQCLMDPVGGKQMPWWEDVDPKQWKALDSHEIFYNDVDRKTADGITAQLQHHAKGGFTSKVTYPAFKHIPSTYIICEKDNAIPAAAQEAMAQQPGSKFSIERLDASHSPWLSKLPETVNAVRKAIGEQV